MACARITSYQVSHNFFILSNYIVRVTSQGRALALY